MTATEEIRNVGYMWRALESSMPEVKEEVELMKPCSDRKVGSFVWLLPTVLPHAHEGHRFVSPTVMCAPH